MRTALATQIVAVAVVAAAAPATASEGGLRIPFEATLQVTSLVIFPGQPGHEARCGQAPVQVVEGAGTATLLGPVLDNQSHCIGLPVVDSNGVHIPFFLGAFELEAPFGRTLKGEYSGRLVPTLTAHIPTGPQDPPSGSWIIEGDVCIKSASHLRIVDDCAAGRFSAARGITDLGTGAGTIFLNQTIKLRW